MPRARSLQDLDAWTLDNVSNFLDPVDRHRLRAASPYFRDVLANERDRDAVHALLADSPTVETVFSVMAVLIEHAERVGGLDTNDEAWFDGATFEISIWIPRDDFEEWAEERNIELGIDDEDEFRHEAFMESTQQRMIRRVDAFLDSTWWPFEWDEDYEGGNDHLTATISFHVGMPRRAEVTMNIRNIAVDDEVRAVVERTAANPDFDAALLDELPISEYGSDDE